MNKTYNDIIIVDKSDNPIGHKQLPDAVKAGDITRVSRIFLFNKKGELLLQKRSQHVMAPGLLCESAAGHVDQGEDYQQAAHRELKEELGIETVLEKCIWYYHEEVIEDFSIRRFNVIYVAHWDGELDIDPQEVADVEFISIQDLENRIVANPHMFPEGFIYAYYQYKNCS